MVLFSVSCRVDTVDPAVSDGSSDDTGPSSTTVVHESTVSDSGVTTHVDPATDEDTNTTFDPSTSTSTSTTGVIESSDTSTDESTGSGTSGGDDEPYTSCPCQDGHETCVPFSSEGTVFANSCYLLGCEEDDDCPLTTTGTATPVCVTTLFRNGACALDCDDGATCPDGMMCYEVMLGGGLSMFRCAWPVE